MAPPFKAGTREQITAGTAQFPNTETFINEGSPAPIITPGGFTFVGRVRRGSRVVDSGTRIYHRTVIYPTKDSSGRITGSKRVLYIEKNNRYQPAAVSTDGGDSYVFSDPEFPTMDGVAGVGLSKELNDPYGAIHKNIDNAVARTVKSDPAVTLADRAVLIESQKNTEVSPEEEEAVDPKDGETPSANDPDKTPPPAPIQNVSIAEKEGTRDQFPGKGGIDALTYPVSLRNSKQDKMQFNMIKYQPSGVDNAGFGSPERQQQFRPEDIIGRVFLPIPAGITDTTGASWGDGEMSAIQTALAQVALGGINEGVSGALGAAQGQIDKIAGNRDNAEDVKTALRNQIAGEAAGVQGLLTRTTGAILNPNLELLFSKPTLRPFNFRFKLSARSQAEANQIIKIIRFFKQGMAPIRSKSNLFIKAPHTFKIRYIHNNEDHPFLNRFKECALKNLTVNYTPEGNYATFRDGKMVSYELTMSFQELEPIFNDDYSILDGNQDTTIGF